MTGVIPIGWRLGMTIDIRDGQPQLSDLLDLMAAGDEVLIVEGDR